MKLKDLRNNTPPPTLEKIAHLSTQYIWTADYWDGAISGMLEYQNELFWFEMTQENEHWKKDQWYRRYAIVKLSKAQIQKEIEVHEDFQRYVGTHYDGKPLKTPPKLEAGKMNEFYTKHSEYVRSRSFENNEVLGWMEQ